MPIALGIGIGLPFGGSGASFSPLSQIIAAGNGWWHDFSDTAALFQESTPVTPAGSGDPLGYAKDKSGKGFHATQASSSLRPVLATLSGKLAASFDGSTQYLSADGASAIFTGNDTPNTLHIAIYPLRNTAAEYALAVGNSTTTNPFVVLGRNTAGGGVLAGGNFSRRSVTADLVYVDGLDWRINEWQVWSVRFNGTTVDLWLNGILLANGSPLDTAALTLNAFSYGALRRTTLTNYFQGGVGECWGVPGAQSDADVATAHRYLLSKWRGQAVQDVDLFGIIGQSNAQGQGDVTQSPAVTYGTAFQIPATGKVVPLADSTSGNGKGSAWPAFANKWMALTGKPSFWVAMAANGKGVQPGSSDPSWDVATGTLHPAALASMHTAVTILSKSPGYRLRHLGLQWAGGESDAVYNNGTTVTPDGFETGFTAIIESWKTEFPSQFWKFLIYELGTTNNGTLTAEFDAIRQKQDDVAAAVDGAAMVFTGAKDFLAAGKMIDIYHYTQAGYNEMGDGGATAAAALL